MKCRFRSSPWVIAALFVVLAGCSGASSTGDGGAGGKAGADASVPQAGTGGSDASAGTTGAGGAMPDGAAPEIPAPEGGVPEVGPATSDAADAPSPVPDGGPEGGVPVAPGDPLKLCATRVDCPAGSACILADELAIGLRGHCYADGAGGGRCKPGLVCDEGFTCDGVGNAPRCRGELKPGALCSFESGSCQKSLGFECYSIPAGSPGMCQSTSGRAGFECRRTSPACDAGLGCTYANGGRCQPLTTDGTCGDAVGCDEGKTCNRTSKLCIANGLDGGKCSTGAPCATGLVCDISVCIVGPTLGQPCSNTCAAGLTCSGTPLKCLANGTLRAQCRPDHTCDAGSYCSESDFCTSVPVTPDGVTCSSGGCKYGSGCVGTPAKCVPRGAKGGICRFPDPSCDAGLVCDLGICIERTTAVGAACTANSCVAGAQCVWIDDGLAPAGRCVVDGAQGGACRAAGPAYCDAGLGCYPYPQKKAGVGPDLVCMLSGALGAQCSTNAASQYRCSPGTSCAGFACLADGKLGAACRVGDARAACEPLLGCVGGKCVSGLAEGATCDPSGANACGMPSICVTTAGTSKCAPRTYEETVVAALPFVDACADGIRVPLSFASGLSHSAMAINLPFPFKFWGSDQTQVWPSTRGTLAFGAEPHMDTPLGNGYLPLDAFGPIAAPFWDEIYLGTSTAMPDLCYKLVGAAPNRRFVVEWAHMRRFGFLGIDLAFEVVLHESTNVVELAYDKLAFTGAASQHGADGSRASIGLQSGQNGLGVRHEGTVIAGGGLRYTPRP